MGALLAVLLLAGQDPGLLERLDDDDPAARDAASLALARSGERAVPLLTRALTHLSPEVRRRASDLLVRLPDYRWTLLLAQPDSAAAIRYWNAIVDACVAKRPIPASVWKEIGPEHEEEQTWLVEAWEVRGNHDPAWIVGRIRDEAVEAIRSLAGRIGIEGEAGVERLLGRRGLRRAQAAHSVDLLARLAELGAGEAVQEEIYGTILIVRRDDLLPVFSELSAADWDVVLRFMIHLRDRPGDRDPRPPRTTEEALARAARGPGVSGIASGLARHFGRRDKVLQKLEGLEEDRVPRESRWGLLAAVYEDLARLDRDFADRFPPLGGDKALPRRKPPAPDRPSVLVEAVCRQGPLAPDELGVVEAIAEGVARPGDLELRAALLRIVARQVVEQVERR